MWRRLVGVAGSYFRRSYRQMKKVIGGDEPQQSQEKSLECGLLRGETVGPSVGKSLQP